MTDRPKSTFARRIHAAKPRDRKYEIRDGEISGLGLTIHPSGVRTFFIRRMVRGRIRYATVGNADTMTLPQARREARELIAAFLDTVKENGGPRTPGRPMIEFADEFLERYARHWKNSAYVVRKYTYPPSAISPWTPSPSNMSGTGSPPWPSVPAMPTARCRSCPS